MGYFANGSEGDDYEAKWCRHCVHQTTDDRMCPVLEAHLLYNYQQTKHDACGKDIGAILSIFIPRDEKGGNGRCKMYSEVDS